MNLNIFLILIFLSSVFSAFLPYKGIKNNNIFIWALPFSGAFLFSISFLHLVPDTIEELGHSAGLYILLGFILQLFLQKFSLGIEHGHGVEKHHHHHHHLNFGLILGLSVHAFIEGIPLGYNFREAGTLSSLSLGIIAHKIPETFSLAIMLLQAPKFKKHFWFIIISFSLITPLTAFMAQSLGNKFHFIASILPYFVSLAIGSFVLIATTIFFESEGNKHDLPKAKFIALASGFILAILLEFINH